jgi:glycosyltransferase involved in cell wall biosynthesis
VLEQDYPEIEYAVMDGGSDDETLEILRGFGERVHWRSRQDDGAADALREGFAGASGEILGWLNADDWLLPGAVRGAVEAFARHPEAAAVYADAWWTDDGGQKLKPYPVGEATLDALGRECVICQPACFFRAEAYRACGGIDGRWHTVFDWDLWIRLAKAGKLVKVPGEWALSRMHASNKTLGEKRRVFEEGMKLLSEHYGYVPFEWVYSAECFRRDGRDQFYEPLAPSAAAWMKSLPAGLRRNPRQAARYVGEWWKAFSLAGLARQIKRVFR